MTDDRAPVRPDPDAPEPRRCGLCGEWNTRPSLLCARCENLRRCALCSAWHRRARLLCALCDGAVRLDALVAEVDDQHRLRGVIDELVGDLADVPVAVRREAAALLAQLQAGGRGE